MCFPDIRSTGLSSKEFAMKLLEQENVACVPGAPSAHPARDSSAVVMPPPSRTSAPPPTGWSALSTDSNRHERATPAHGFRAPHPRPRGAFRGVHGFMLVLQLAAAMIGWDHPQAPWWRRDPAHFIYPLQTLVTLGLVIYYWRFITFNWSLKWALIAVPFGALGIAFWLLPDDGL
jgi:hypothetical protein